MVVWLGWQPSVIIGAAQVVAALGADQLAVVAGQGLAAVGADLLVMRGRGRSFDVVQIFIGKIGVKIGIECRGTLRKHVPEISMERGLRFQLSSKPQPSIFATKNGTVTPVFPDRRPDKVSENTH